MNLLHETLEILKANNKTEKHVLWVGNKTHKTTWKKFKDVAMDTSYDSGYGSQEVAEDLLVVGKDFWLERHEYDGSEWWEYKEMPKEPVLTINLMALTTDQSNKQGFDVSVGWEGLLEINGIKSNK